MREGDDRQAARGMDCTERVASDDGQSVSHDGNVSGACVEDGLARRQEARSERDVIPADQGLALAIRAVAASELAGEIDASLRLYRACGEDRAVVLAWASRQMGGGFEVAIEALAPVEEAGETHRQDSGFRKEVEPGQEARAVSASAS